MKTVELCKKLADTGSPKQALDALAAFGEEAEDALDLAEAAAMEAEAPRSGKFALPTMGTIRKGREILGRQEPARPPKADKPAKVEKADKADKGAQAPVPPKE
jgi:hypothetical protein